MHRAGIYRGGGRAAPRPGRPLLQPTGPHRQLPVVCADLAGLAAVAHRHGGTVNDAVLAAVTGALHRLLEQRGGSVDALAVTVPVARRRSGSYQRRPAASQSKRLALPTRAKPAAPFGGEDRLVDVVVANLVNGG